MKIVLISNSLTHYYNRVLSKLNDDSDIDLTVVVPGNGSPSVGAGVYQDSSGIKFKVVIKSIPFRIEAFDKRLKALAGGSAGADRRGRLNAINPWRWVRSAKVYVDRYIYRSADAHLNYIDARNMWSSYGVAAERVF